MRWIAILCALTMLMACNKDNDKTKKGNADDNAAELTLLQKANALADKVCACPDAACFQALESEGDAMANSMDKAMAIVSDADKSGFMSAMTRIGQCAEKLASAGGAEAPTAVDEAAAAIEAAVPANLDKAVDALKALEGAAPALGKAAEAVKAINAIKGQDLGADLKKAAVAVEAAAKVTGAAVDIAEKTGALDSGQASKLKCQSRCSANAASCARNAGQDAMAAMKCAQAAQSCVAGCN